MYATLRGPTNCSEPHFAMRPCGIARVGQSSASGFGAQCSKGSRLSPRTCAAFTASWSCTLEFGE